MSHRLLGAVTKWYRVNFTFNQFFKTQKITGNKDMGFHKGIILERYKLLPLSLLNNKPK